MKKVGIYLHIPFCLSKCHYCDFCSTRAGEEVIEKYTSALCSEILSFRKEHGGSLVADTVYFGGGTPSLLSLSQLERILSALDKSFSVDKSCEITIEVNPKTADREKLSGMYSLGINRLSIGMQSGNDSELKLLGRIHSFEDFKKCYFDAREVGFDNISADLMYGIPDQSEESFACSMEKLTALAPEHISSYCLTIEEGTNFYKRQGKLNFPNEDKVSDMYSQMSEYLSSCGYKKYEISNFARDGFESRHNLKYWRCREYIGFGAAAHSYFNDTRYAHSRDIETYLRGESIICDIEMIDREEQMREFLMLGMRLSKGVELSSFREKFGLELTERFPKIKNYCPEFITLTDEKCSFSEKGFFVSNFILADLLD